jgi:protein phosphatase 1 regulatory subunit 7
MEERINDPAAIDRELIESIFLAGKTPTLQFSKPCYSRPILADIDKLCQEYGSKIEVRFYGHYSGAFDASILKYLPNVSWLSVDCLLRATNIGSLAGLSHLKKLSLGIYHLDDADILKKINIGKLERLVVGENNKKNIDLSPLSLCELLKELYIVGHTKGIGSVRTLSSLRTLSLGSIPNKQQLDFVNDITSLRRLVIILGGRNNISELRHPQLEELEILRVRGFNDCDSLSTLPGLRHLAIEDQIKLERIAFTDLSSSIRYLRINNCKGLKRIDGLEKLRNLVHLRISRTAVDVDRIMVLPKPDSLDVFALYSGKVKKDSEIRKTLDSRGYRESEWSKKS